MSCERKRENWEIGMRRVDFRLTFNSMWDCMTLLLINPFDLMKQLRKVRPQVWLVVSKKSSQRTHKNNGFMLFWHFQEWHGLLSSSFAAVLLLSSSTLVAIVLIIQSELEIETSAIVSSTVKLPGVTRKSSMKKTSIKTSTTTTTTPSSESSQTATDASDRSHSPSNSIKKQQKTAMKFSNLSSTNRGVKSAICLSWLLPILCAMCIPMIHAIIGHRASDWWLELASPEFIVFAITESLLVFLFALLFVTLLKHLIYLSRKYEKVNMLKKRWA